MSRIFLTLYDRHVLQKEEKILKTIKIFIFVLLIRNKTKLICCGAASNLIKWYLTPSSTTLISRLQRFLTRVLTWKHMVQGWVPSPLRDFYFLRLQFWWKLKVSFSLSLAMFWSLKLSLSMIIHQKRDTCLDSSLIVSNHHLKTSEEKNHGKICENKHAEPKSKFFIYFDMWNTN